MVEKQLTEIYSSKAKREKEFIRYSELAILALKKAGKDRACLPIQINLLLTQISKESTLEELNQHLFTLRDLILRVPDNNHIIKSSVLKRILESNCNPKLKHLAILDFLADPVTAENYKNAITEFFDSSVTELTNLQFTKFVHLIEISSSLKGAPLIKYRNSNQSEKILIKVRSGLPVEVENVKLKIYLTCKKLEIPLPGSTYNATPNSDWMNQKLIDSFVRKCSTETPQIEKNVIMEITDKNTPAQKVAPVNKRNIYDTNYRKKKISSYLKNNFNLKHDRVIESNGLLLNQGENSYSLEIDSEDFKPNTSYQISGLTLEVGPYKFIEDDSANLNFRLDCITRPHKLSLDKEELLSKKQLFTSFVHTVKLKLTIGDDTEGGCVLKLLFDPIELEPIFNSETITSSYIMRGDQQLDSDVEFALSIDENDIYLLTEVVKTNASDPPRIRLQPLDVVYIRIPICMRGSVYNIRPLDSDLRETYENSSISTGFDGQSISHMSSNTHVQSNQNSRLASNESNISVVEIVSGTVSAWLEPKEQPISNSLMALPSLFSFQFRPPIEPTASIKNVVSITGSITKSYVIIKWANVSNEPISFQKASCIPAGGLKSTCDLKDCTKFTGKSITIHRNSAFTCVYEVKEIDPWDDDIALIMCSIQICVGYENCGYSTMSFTVNADTKRPIYVADFSMNNQSMAKETNIGDICSVKLIVRQLREDPLKNRPDIEDLLEQSMDTSSVMSSSVSSSKVSQKSKIAEKDRFAIYYEVVDPLGAWAVSGKKHGVLKMPEYPNNGVFISKGIDLIPMASSIVHLPEIKLRRLYQNDKGQFNFLPNFQDYQLMFNNKFQSIKVQ